MRKSKKDLILKAAAKEFSKKGYESASLEDIVAECGITKAAIYYHFKDKAALYEAVLFQRLCDLEKKIQKSLSEADTSEDRLSAYVNTFGLFLQENRCFAAILAHEFADNGIHMSDNATKELSKILNILTSILNNGMKSSQFEITNPMVIQMMVVSTLIVHKTTKDLRKRVTDNISREYEIRPEPDIVDFAKILSENIMKIVKKEKL